MTARIPFSSLLLAASLAATLAACAGTPGARSIYSQELDQLTADCRAREGILSPVGGSTTGRPQTDYVCEIRGGGSRIPRN